MYHLQGAESPESSDAAFADSSRSPSQRQKWFLFSPVISNNRSDCRTTMSAKLLIILSLKAEGVKK